MAISKTEPLLFAASVAASLTRLHKHKRYDRLIEHGKWTNTPRNADDGHQAGTNKKRHKDGSAYGTRIVVAKKTGPVPGNNLQSIDKIHLASCYGRRH